VLGHLISVLNPNPSVSIQRGAVERILTGHDRVLAAVCRNAGTNAGMAASKGRSTFGVVIRHFSSLGSWTDYGLKCHPKAARTGLCYIESDRDCLSTPSARDAVAGGGGGARGGE
jgi:hypothetical protein